MSSYIEPAISTAPAPAHFSDLQRDDHRMTDRLRVTLS